MSLDSVTRNVGFVFIRRLSASSFGCYSLSGDCLISLESLLHSKKKFYFLLNELSSTYSLLCKFVFTSHMNSNQVVTRTSPSLLPRYFSNRCSPSQKFGVVVALENVQKPSSLQFKPSKSLSFLKAETSSKRICSKGMRKLESVKSDQIPRKYIIIRDCRDFREFRKAE